MKNILNHVSSSVVAALHVRKGSVAEARTMIVGAMLMGVFFLSLQGMAEASNFDDIAGDTVENTNVAANIVTYISYIGGAILAALGVVDLKKHVENPGQNPMKNGLAKLGFGGMLIALPFIVNATIGTFGGENTQGAQYNPISDKNFNVGG